jgi:amidase
VIPESHNFDIVGTFGRTVPDAALALDAIYDDNYSHSVLFTSYASNRDALKDTMFGVTWLRI